MVAPIPDPACGAWPAKFAQVILEKDYQFEFWGWDRGGFDSGNADLGEFKSRLLVSGGTRRDIGTILRYLIWMCRIFWHTIRVCQQTVMVAVSFDTGLPIAAASFFTGLRFVFANRDNLSKSYPWPNVVRRCIEGLERFIVRYAHVHILPGRSRWHRITEKEVIIPNSPTTSTLRTARRIARSRSFGRSDVLTLYVNGWLVDSRGLDVIYGAVQQIPSAKLNVLLAGKDMGKAAGKLAQLPNVRYLSTISPAESLARYYQSHLVLTFYDPALEINRLAEPNKWQDCIATQTPFIVNREVQTARPFIAANCCVHVPYHDVGGLRDALLRLADNRAEWQLLQSNLSRFEAPAWDVQIADILATLCLENGDLISNCSSIRA